MSGAEMIRNQRWRLAIIRHVEEITQNVAKTCRYYGISRMAFYTLVLGRSRRIC